MPNSGAVLRRLSMVLPLTLLAGLPTAEAAESRGEVVVSATDEPNDVKLLRVDGPTPRVRRTIDLRKVTVVRRSDAVRLTIRVKDLRPTADFDQMAFIWMRPEAGSSTTWEVTAGLSAQQPTQSYAYLFLDADGTDYETCDPLDAVVLWRRESVRLDVPLRCIPEEPARIKVHTYAGFFRSDAGTWSKDVLRIPGAYQLR